MKNLIRQNISDLLAHRRLLVVLGVMALFALGIAIYIAVTIEASDLRVITHYTAYGVTHFYRDSWMHLLTFIASALITVVFITGICLKLLRQEREPLALLFGWIGVGILCFMAMTYLHIAELV